MTSDQFDKPAEQIRAAAEALLESLYREYPEGLPFYCRTQAENLDRALHPEIYSDQFDKPFECDCNDYDKAKQWMLDQASQFWLEAECLEHYERYIAAGDNPWQAASCALYDWDI